jgi:hypothetical protein
MRAVRAQALRYGAVRLVGPTWSETVNKSGFSWKRALGITRAKQRISRATGIPWTRSGRQRKVGSVFWKLFK